MNATISRFLKCILILLLGVPLTSVFAQVGFNNANPDPNSILDMSAVTDKGLLIPNLDKTQRRSLSDKNPKNNMLVFDPTEKLFYFLNVTDKRWYVLNSWKLSYNPAVSTDDITKAPLIIDNGHAVGIGTTGAPSATLEVNGTIKSGAITTTQGITGGSVTAATVNATTLNADNIVTKQNISAGKITGDGIVPAGVIVMWSGEINQIPAGWALCNGSAVNGFPVPNLSGRFIVGYDGNDGDYNAVKKVGPVFQDADHIIPSDGTNTQDAKRIKLTANQSGLRDHTHTIYTDLNSHGTGKNEGLTGGNRQDNWIRGVNGGAQPAIDAHENRPPYYVLAYIMKLP